MMTFMCFLIAVFIFWLGMLAGQWWFGDHLYPYRHKCDGTCYEDIPFRIASNEKTYVRQAMINHIELQHE